MIYRSERLFVHRGGGRVARLGLEFYFRMVRGEKDNLGNDEGGINRCAPTVKYNISLWSWSLIGGVDGRQGSGLELYSRNRG